MPDDKKVKTMEFVLPTDEEAMGFLANLLQSSNTPPENQISFRLWLTDVLQDAGRVAMPPTGGGVPTGTEINPVTGEPDGDPNPEHPVQ